MRTKQAGYINLDFTALFVAFALIGALVGAGLTIALPRLWEILKPIIHSATGG